MLPPAKTGLAYPAPRTNVANISALARITVAGGLGGGLNAALCVLGWPVPVADVATFRWHLIPAGMAHGALLALVAVTGALAARGIGVSPWRWLAIPAAGWLAGYASWIPMEMSIFGRSFLRALTWPAASDRFSLAIVWSPLVYFGGVSALLCLWLTARHRERPRWLNVVGGVAAAVGGSLCWWIEWRPWYFSVLHGVTWGSLVGFAAGGLDLFDGRWDSIGLPPLSENPPPIAGFPPGRASGTL